MIPEIDVRGCIAKKKTEGTLSFSFDADGALVDIPYVGFSSPVSAELAYRICEDDAVEVRGSIAFSLAGACSRCLSEAQARITGEVEGVFVPGTGDGEAYGYRGGKVSLAELLRDSVMFALPARLLCTACSEWEKE